MCTRGISAKSGCIFVIVKFLDYHLVYLTAEDICGAEIRAQETTFGITKIKGVLNDQCGSVSPVLSVSSWRLSVRTLGARLADRSDWTYINQISRPYHPIVSLWIFSLLSIFVTDPILSVFSSRENN